MSVATRPQVSPETPPALTPRPSPKRRTSPKRLAAYALLGLVAVVFISPMLPRTLSRWCPTRST